jgi:epidermal growth factor receptor substrate 15
MVSSLTPPFLKAVISRSSHRDLADLNDDGRLTRDGFAVAWHLIQGKIAGKDIPTTLPASLMPPSMRAATVSATSPFQKPASEPLGDLIWDDSPSSPAMPQSQSSIFQPQKTGSLSPQSTFSPFQVAGPQTQGQGVFAPPGTVYCSHRERWKIRGAL